MKNIASIMLIGCVLVGCVAPAPIAKKTSLEIQAVQAKSFEADKSLAFKSVMSVLQDLGYVVGSASLETGFITAESPTQEDTSGSAVLGKILGGVRTETKSVVTASIEDINSSNSRVRLNFVHKAHRSSQYGQSGSDDTPVMDTKVYENAFEKIGEAIFIRKNQK
jgi:hypothetical protein